METTIIMATIFLLAVSFIPNADARFDEWQRNFMTYLRSHAAAWGIDPLEVSALETLQTDWDTKYAAGGDEADPKPSQRLAKNTSRKNYAKALRKFIKDRINPNAAVTTDDRSALGITVYDNTRTRVTIPTVQPAGTISKIKPHEHILSITNPETPTSRAKPKGVHATRVFRFVGATAPNDVHQYRLIGTATRHIFTSEFEIEDEGKKAFYIFQYENTRGETGPLSDRKSTRLNSSHRT